jgi:bacterioferritin
LINGFSGKARQELQEGAVTEGYRADKEQVIEMLNRALASEWTAFMQYWHHYFMATDIHSAEIKDYFKESATQELHHIDEIGSRIQLLGGVPVAKPAEVPVLWPPTVEYGHDLVSMLEVDLVSERTTIQFYSEIVRFAGNDDITTRFLFEEILREEEDHANDLADLIFAMDASTNKPIETLHEGSIQEHTTAVHRKVA